MSEKLSPPAELNNFDLKYLAEAEKITPGAAEAILKQWVENESTQNLARLKEIEYKEKSIEKDYNFKKHCLYAAIAFAVLTAFIGAYGMAVRAGWALIIPSIVLLAGIGGAYYWGFQKKQ